MSIVVSSQFDGGNIIPVSVNDANRIELEIKKDSNSEFLQWFYFRLTGAKDTDCNLVITNAGKTSYVDGWENYSACASYDRKHWFRIPSQFSDGELNISVKPTQDSLYIAYFAPYTMEQHQTLVATALQSDNVKLELLGKTLDGQDLDYLQIGVPKKGKRNYWVIGRQHPGETMAEWWMQGFLSALLNENNSAARNLLEKCVFHVVPNMNPDGSLRGHLRTNAAGANLNREWQTPSAEKSPEVLYVLNKMRETGLDFCLDVHGDEGLPYNFIAGAEGIPSWDSSKQQALDEFKETLMKVSPDFQTEFGYPVEERGTADMTICTHALAEEFQTLCMTLEMPFKDTANQPMPEQGWSPERSIQLGKDCLQAMWQTLP